jgi:hypothetical protein
LELKPPDDLLLRRLQLSDVIVDHGEASTQRRAAAKSDDDVLGIEIGSIAIRKGCVLIGVQPSTQLLFGN